MNKLSKSRILFGFVASALACSAYLAKSDHFTSPGSPGQCTGDVVEITLNWLYRSESPSWSDDTWNLHANLSGDADYVYDYSTYQSHELVLWTEYTKGDVSSGLTADIYGDTVWEHNINLSIDAYNIEVEMTGPQSWNGHTGDYTTSAFATCDADTPEGLGSLFYSQWGTFYF